MQQFERQDKIETEAVGLAKSLKHCNERINSVDKNISELNENLPMIVSQQISQIIDDKSEVEKREANIIIFGIPKSEKGYSRIKDTEFIQALSRDSLGIDNIVIDEITRLGAKPKKGSGKFKLTRLIVKDNTSRNNLFRNAYKLKDTKIGAHKKIVNSYVSVTVHDNYVSVTVNDNRNELNISQDVSDHQSISDDKKFTSEDKRKSLRVLFSNVDTMSNKRSEFELYLSIEKPHIIGLCEIYPKNSMDKSIVSMLNLPDYEKYIPDKMGDRGVVIYIHKSLTAFKVDILSESGFNESVWCEVKLEGTDKLLLGCIYRSPSSVPSNNKKLNDFICQACNLKYRPLFNYGRL
ncbi:unnamed protein product [Mytilus coruscus]|uniref:Uncharacterized protein n=1 Tax=Mytilus coruscus TaxID=42192 RepID=A0A6J8DHG4_MYTCO|nr:unnamed protein product [Mytilus coruscus]